MSMGIKVGRAVRIRKIFCGKGMWNEDIDSADQHKSVSHLIISSPSDQP